MRCTRRMAAETTVNLNIEVESRLPTSLNAAPFSSMLNAATACVYVAPAMYFAAQKSQAKYSCGLSKTPALQRSYVNQNALAHIVYPSACIYI